MMSNSVLFKSVKRVHSSLSKTDVRGEIVLIILQI